MSGWRGKRRDREDPWFLFHHTWSSSWCWRIPLPKVFSPQQRVFRSSWSLSQGWHPKCHVHITDAKVHSVQQTGGTSISLCLEVQHSLELIQVVDVESYDLRTSLTTSFPWLEYIVRVGWTDDGTHIWAQVGHPQQISAMFSFHKKMLVFSRVDSNLQKTRFCVYIFSFKRNVVSPPAARPEPATLGACPYSRESVCSQV